MASFDSKLNELSKYVRNRNEKEAIKDIEIAKKHAYEYRQGQETIKKGQEFRHIADIPASLFFQLPKEVREDPKALNKWLIKWAPEFLLVDKNTL